MALTGGMIMKVYLKSKSKDVYAEGVFDDKTKK